MMHYERFVAVEFYCLLQDRQIRAVLNLQSTQVLEKHDLKGLWERFSYRLQRQKILCYSQSSGLIIVVSSVEILDIVINVNGLCRNTFCHPLK